MSCPQCGYPGRGNMPTGARTVSHDGKRVLIGQLRYYTTNPPLCSVCEDMVWTLEGRPWFVDAHEEYLQQIKVKKHLLGQK